jgi:hypothetical protein
MKKEIKKLKLSKITVAKLNKNLEPQKRPTVNDWTCNFTVRTCVSFEFQC